MFPRWGVCTAPTATLTIVADGSHMAIAQSLHRKIREALDIDLPVVLKNMADTQGGLVEMAGELHADSIVRCKVAVQHVET